MPDSTDVPVDPKWRSTLRLGSVALILVGVTYVINLYLTYHAGATGVGTDAPSYLQSVSGHWQLNAALWLSYMVGDLLLIPVLALFVLLFLDRGRAWVVAGVGILALYLAFDLGVTEPSWLALTNLAHEYSSANPGQQASLASAAQYALALDPILNSMSFAISVTGFLLLLAVMWGGPVRKGTVVLGTATMILGYGAAASFFVPSFWWACEACVGAFGLWCILTGAQLYRFVGRATAVGEQPRRTPVAPDRGPVSIS